MPSHDRYGSDVLNTDWRAPRRGRAVEIAADKGLVVEEVTTDWCGEIVAVERDLGTVTLEDRRGKRRTFPIGTGFLLEGVPVILVPPARSGPAVKTRTASGSVAVPGTTARVARASRIFVEGRHDAELVEKVWGDDLRVEGVVVEYLEGVDDLAEHLRDFRPGPERRVGVLVDHLVAGSKESRIAASVAKSPVGKHVLIVGHPFIDIWAGGQAGPARHQGLADRAAQHRVEARRLPAARLAAPRPGRHRPRLEAHPRRRALLRRPRPEPARPGRGADRLRDQPRKPVRTT